jgi:hypothetical protein
MGLICLLGVYKLILKLPMSDSRTQSALARIASAIDRIEAAAAHRPVAAITVGDEVRVQFLEARHAKLRQETGAVLASLDAFITQHQGHGG